MKITARTKDIRRTPHMNYEVTFTTDTDLSELAEWKDTLLNIDIKKKSQSRSLDANAYFWIMVSEIALALREDKWTVYLELLKMHGKCEHLKVLKESIPNLRMIWREVEVISIKRKYAEVFLYYGSSTYTRKEMAVLIDDAIIEMESLGLTPPPTADMRRALEQWQNGH